MRGLVALCMMLATAAFSGCVELVDPEASPSEAEVDQAVAEAERTIDEYQAEKGHLAGLVVAADGSPVAGALVDVEGVATDVPTDDEGRFTFIDLDPRVYTVVVEAEGFLPGKAQADVLAGQFARPRVTLEAIPAPEPYYTLYRFEGYANMQPLGYPGCACAFDGELDPEGLTQLILEGELGPAWSPLGSSDRILWDLSLWNSNGSHEQTAAFSGVDESPMRFVAQQEDLGVPSDHFSLYMEPEWGLLPHGGQAFTAYVSAFYHGPAPEGFSAFELE